MEANRGISVIVDHGTMWFTKDQIAHMLGLTRQVIEHHIRRAASEREFSPSSICAQPRCAADGKYYQTRYYALDVFFAIAARVTSHSAKYYAKCWRTYFTRQFAEHPEIFTPHQAA